jgi:serine/threonine-protein kinase
VLGAGKKNPRFASPLASEAATLPRGQAASALASGSWAAIPAPREGASAAVSVVKAGARALASEEASRARGFARAAIVLCVVGLVAVPWLGGATWLRVVAALATLALAVTAGWVTHVARDPLRFDRRVTRIFGGVALATSTLVTYHLGVFTPAPIFVTLGIGFFALCDDRMVAIGLPIVAAAIYPLVAWLEIAGALPDAGALSALDAPRDFAFAMMATVPLVHLLAMVQARVSRRATVDAIERSNFAVREAMRREIELEDANRDLDQLLRLGSGRAGAFTGVMAGKYVVGDLIGAGAMGEVYRATHTSTGEQAAVKLLQPGLLADENVVARFFREGEAASALRAPNVVTIYEVGKTADGAPYIAMELLRGHDLAWHLRQRGQLGTDEMIGVAEQVAAGLEAARVAGIVHRDLKPQNLFLAQQTRAAPLWKILDFGVSRLMTSQGTLTQDQIVGTPGYMSPEQAAGGEATHRSDVFSFGVVVYRSLTGAPPFAGPETPQILYQVVYRNPDRPSAVVGTIPADVDLVLAIALAKDPEDRFASALEMASALRDAAAGRLAPATRLHAQTLLAALPWGGDRR